MSLRVAPPREHRGRVEQALYFRCRRGEPAALATLAYRLMDRLYTAASFVAPDEASATTAVVLAWEDTLVLLKGRRVGGHLHVRALDCLGRHLGDYADRPTVRRALNNAAQEDEDVLLPLPEETVRSLIEMARGHAPEVAAAYQERHALRQRLVQSVAAVAVLMLLYGGWLALGPGLGTDDVKLRCLQQRIVRQEAIESLRTFVGELPDPQGADRLRARALQEVSLALEEMVNTRSRQSLHYLVARLVREQLAEQLTEIAQEYEGAPRRELMQTQLLIEEMQDL